MKSSGRTSAVGVSLRPRRKPVQERSLKRLDQIVEAAHRILKASGVSALTTNAVAAEAGMSVGSLYEYFPNKESIVMHLYEGKLALLRARAPDLTGGAPGCQDWRSFLSTYIRTLKAAERDLDIDAALFESVRNLPRLSQVELLHSQWIAGEFVRHMRYLGSPWSDAALFDLGMYLHALDTATWQYCGRVGEVTPLAIDRAVDAALALAAPAMTGASEPGGRLARRSQQDIPAR